MKTLILILFCCLSLIGITGGAQAQADKVTQVDSIRSGKDSITFLVNSRHNYNTVFFRDLVVQDTIKVYHINENGQSIPVALRDLNTNLDLEGNQIRGMSGNHEFLVLHPNLYRLAVAWDRTSALSKTIYITRRGNNLK